MASYTTKTGDNWLNIANKLYKNAKMATALANANKDVKKLKAGVTIKLPKNPASATAPAAAPASAADNAYSERMKALAAYYAKKKAAPTPPPAPPPKPPKPPYRPPGNNKVTRNTQTARVYNAPATPTLPQAGLPGYSIPGVAPTVVNPPSGPRFDTETAPPVTRVPGSGLPYRYAPYGYTRFGTNYYVPPTYTGPPTPRMTGITRTRLPDAFEAQIVPAATQLQAQIMAYSNGELEEPPRQIGDAEALYMASTAGLTTDEFATIMQDLGYIRRENGYSYAPPEPAVTTGAGGGNRSWGGRGYGGGGGGRGGGGGGAGGWGGWSNDQGLPEMSRYGRVFDPSQFGLISWRF